MSRSGIRAQNGDRLRARRGRCPTRTPPENVTRLNREINATVNTKTFKDRGAVASMVSRRVAQAFVDEIANERRSWGKTISDRKLGIQQREGLDAPTWDTGVRTAACFSFVKMGRGKSLSQVPYQFDTPCIAENKNRLLHVVSVN